MANSDDESPRYLENYPAFSDGDYWDDIADRFNELVDLLNSVQLESKEQAIPQPHGIETKDRGTYWHDPTIGAKVRAWQQVPYDPHRDIEDFGAKWETAVALAEWLKPKIASREMSAETLSKWGSFCEYASIVEHEYQRDRPDLQHLKGAAAQNRHHHKVWFSHLFMLLRREGDKRSDTEGRVIDHLISIIERNNFPHPDFPKRWFQEFLGETTNGLTSSFLQNKLPMKKIKRLAQEPLDEMPPLNW